VSKRHFKKHPLTVWKLCSLAAFTSSFQNFMKTINELCHFLIQSSTLKFIEKMNLNNLILTMYLKNNKIKIYNSTLEVLTINKSCQNLFKKTLINQKMMRIITLIHSILERTLNFEKMITLYMVSFVMYYCYKFEIYLFIVTLIYIIPHFINRCIIIK
jgi:hypothetical protein